jgi:hypothetical protein
MATTTKGRGYKGARSTFGTGYTGYSWGTGAGGSTWGRTAGSTRTAKTTRRAGTFGPGTGYKSVCNTCEQ